MINAGIVGLGWWGKNIVNAVQGKSERLRFVRGVSKEPDSVREFAGQHGFELSTELDDVLRDPNVEAVVLATPHSLHADQIVAVAGSGKPVFSEKPLCLKRADAERAVGACRKAGIVLGVGLNKRLWPSMRELRKVVESGELGRVLHVEGHYSNENSGKFFAPWRDLPSESPGGGMTGAGLHMLDAFVSVTGQVKRVQGQLLAMKPQPDPLDVATCLIEFANGVSGMIATVRASPLYWRCHVFGDQGSVEALGENDLVIRRKGNQVERRTFEPVDSLKAEFEDFAEAVAGRKPFHIPMQQMVETVAAFDAVCQTLASGQPVDVAPVR